jgi:uncharacterized protein (TIGR03435 family)
VNRSGTTQTNINFPPGGVTFTNLQLRAIIQFAYGISQPSRLAGVPDWANNERFDIVARGDVTSLEDRRVKLQALLADRFKLAAHTEQRSIPIYTLVLARSAASSGRRSSHQQSTAPLPAADALERRRWATPRLNAAACDPAVLAKSISPAFRSARLPRCSR